MDIFKKNNVIFFERTTGDNKIDISGTNRIFRILDFSDFSGSPFFKPEFRSEYNNRFSNGSRCAALIDDNEIVNISWIAFNSLFINEIHKKYIIPEGNIVIYDVFTPPQYRGKGIYPVMLEMINRWAFTNGYKNSIIYSESENISSIRGITKAGYIKKESVTCINIFRLRFHYKS